MAPHLGHLFQLAAVLPRALALPAAAPWTQSLPQPVSPFPFPSPSLCHPTSLLGQAPEPGVRIAQALAQPLAQAVHSFGLSDLLSA